MSWRGKVAGIERSVARWRRSDDETEEHTRWCKSDAIIVALNIQLAARREEMVRR
jgi:hypothetical protein